MLTVAVVLVVALLGMAVAYLYGIWITRREARRWVDEAYQRGMDDAATYLVQF
jgi:membrane protein DedA with SNARE-associated domain